MSRKAALPVSFSKNVQVTLDKNILTVKGPKGSLQQELLPSIKLEISEDKIKVDLATQDPSQKAFLGLFWSLIQNMVIGVTAGFEKKLEMVGVGYRASVQGNLLDVQVGFSHPTKMTIPEGLEVSVEKNTQITIKGLDKQRVGQFAADVRAKRPPEPYKGKGIRYSDEYVRRKAGKAGKK